MKKSDILDKYWYEYLIWCATMPDSSATELYRWLKYKDPTEQNFWQWIVDIKKSVIDKE